MRTARRKREAGISASKLVDHVRQGLLSNGVKRISAFLPPGRKPRMVAIELTGRPVSWRSFFNEFTLFDEAGNEVGQLSGDERTAKYLIHAAIEGIFLLEVPADAIVATKAVQDYEIYLGEVGQELMERLLDATRDHQMAERLARQILAKEGISRLAIEKAMGG